jgi:hypothetical protein
MLPVLHLSLDRLDGEDPGREEGVALFCLWRDVAAGEAKARSDLYGPPMNAHADGNDQDREPAMESGEIQARAAIAAALIVSRAVEVPSSPTSGDWSHDAAALRLRELTEYVYRLITSPQGR